MPASAWPWPCRRRSISSEPHQQRSRGVAAVADRVLLLVRELGHRQPLGALPRQERRVIAKAALAARLLCQRSRAVAVKDALDAAGGVDVGDRAYVAQRASDRRLSQQLGQVLRVACALAGVAGRAYARRASQ